MELASTWQEKPRGRKILQKGTRFAAALLRLLSKKQGGKDMFGMEYIPAFIKMFFELAFAVVTAIPFTICWNCVARNYLFMMPATYQKIPYWHMVAILYVITIIGQQVAKLTPKIVSVSQDNTNSTGEKSQ